MAKLDSVAAAQIRRGRLKVEATLDLHGHTQLTAHAALLRFLSDAQARGLRLVLIITGKGGILREQLPRWLHEPPLHKMVIAYDVAGQRHGAEGAWYVRIRKHKP